VKVRVVKMNGVDIGLFQFDYDLTWMSFFMNANGHTYARYGMRKDEHADGMLSSKGLMAVMKGALEAHKTGAERTPAAWTKRTPDAFKSVPEPIRTGKSCMHCHQVWAFERKDAGGITKQAAQELYPLPENLGITMEVDEPNRVAAVAEGSPAAKAKVAKGDRVTAINGTPVLSSADVAVVLHNLAEARVTLEVGERKATLDLPAGWKKRDISWRSTMWALRPAPGFGGKMLTADERKQAGISGPWAIRVNYIVDWGDQAALGAALKKAGLKKTDLVVSVAGKNDFKTELEMQTWFRLTQKDGTDVEVILWRDGKPQAIQIPVVE
jgi:hypothetical protein